MSCQPDTGNEVHKKQVNHMLILEIATGIMHGRAEGLVRTIDIVTVLTTPEGMLTHRGAQYCSGVDRSCTAHMSVLQY